MDIGLFCESARKESGRVPGYRQTEVKVFSRQLSNQSVEAGMKGMANILFWGEGGVSGVKAALLTE